LEDKAKWNYINSLLKLLKDKQIMAEKNCDECIYRLETTTDVNLELFFEDWRECSGNCDECNIETLKEMCNTQLDIMNHMSNSLIELQMKQNMLVKFVYRRDDSGKKILKGLLKASKRKPPDNMVS